jgi:hypothetical protein
LIETDLRPDCAVEASIDFPRRVITIEPSMLREELVRLVAADRLLERPAGTTDS